MPRKYLIKLNTVQSQLQNCACARQLQIGAALSVCVWTMDEISLGNYPEGMEYSIWPDKKREDKYTATLTIIRLFHPHNGLA